MTTQKNHSFQELPKMHSTYAAVIKSLIPSRDDGVRENELPSAVYDVPKLVIDQGNLKEYRKVCGFINDGRVPATYFAVLSQTLQMNMMAKPDFPFAMLGLIHIHNSVTQHRVIYDSEVVSLSVRLANLKLHDKGQQFDFITEVHSEGKLVWQGTSTYLSRQKTKRSSQKTPHDITPKLEKSADGLELSFKAEEDIGRRYAFVSGDFNLIHLHPLSARAFGYPKAIAHGMWSNAKVLSLFEKLPEAFSCEVDFKAPIFLPSTVQLIACPDGADWQFGVYAKDGEKPHLLGHIRKL